MTTQELLDCLESHYDFVCAGGPLKNCVEWQQLRARLTADDARIAELEAQHLADGHRIAELAGDVIDEQNRTTTLRRELTAWMLQRRVYVTTIERLEARLREAQRR